MSSDNNVWWYPVLMEGQTLLADLAEPSLTSDARRDSIDDSLHTLVWRSSHQMQPWKGFTADA